jgi:tetratricopeptide (TPR) repeat protein
MRRFVALVALVSLTARAEDIEVAKGHYKLGVVYFDRGEYQQALVEFRAAQSASARPELEFNIARTYEMLGDAAHSLRHYRKYLAAQPQASDAPPELLERLQRRVGKLRIVTAAPRIRVDGELLEPDELPVCALTEGPHLVSIEGDGVEAKSAPVQIRAQTETTIELGAPIAKPQIAKQKPRSWRGLWIGLGIGGAVIVVGAVALGVAFGTADHTNYWTSAQTGCAATCTTGDFR